MLENSTQNKKEHRLVLVVAYAEFNKNLNENALLTSHLQTVLYGIMLSLIVIPY